MRDTEKFNQLRNELRSEILAVDTSSFESLALKIFRFQVQYMPVYGSFVGLLGRQPDSITRIEDIPFLPVSFFKQHPVRSDKMSGQGKTFESSGTTGHDTSRHFVADLPLYEALSVRLFEAIYGPLSNYHILALLPSYLERSNSSLVYMVKHFMKTAGSEHSGFYLDDFDSLNTKLAELQNLPDGRKVLLIGVTFALLDWAEQYVAQSRFRMDTSQLVVMETGGMKGRRKEMLRQEVHDSLRQTLGVASVHSEYGMTELVSQAYSTGDGVFTSSDTIRVLIRDITDPLAVGLQRQTGGINVVDLGNLDSCAFIETADLGRINGQSFEVVGRLDNSDVRGCNLLYL